MVHFIIFSVEQFFLLAWQYVQAGSVLRSLSLKPVDPRLLVKMQVYATLVPQLLIIRYARMIGKRLSHNERRAVILISALMPMNDEFVDKLVHDAAYIDAWFVEHNSREPKDDHEYSQQVLLRALYDTVDREILVKPLLDIHEAQLASLKQQDTRARKKLEKLTQDKGGYTSLLYARLINPSMSTTEYEAMFAYGYWMQLVDDLTDIAKDQDEGVHTLATELGQDVFLAILDSQQKLMRSLILKLPYPTRRKQAFLYASRFFAELGKSFFGKQQRELPQGGLYRVISFMSHIRYIYGTMRHESYLW